MNEAGKHTATPKARCAAKACLRASESSGTFGPRNGTSCQTLSHSGLPARTGSTPTLDDLWWQTQADELARILRARPTALVDDGTRKHVFGQLRQLLVFVWLDLVRIHALQIRAGSTARGELAHVDWPFAC